MTLCIIHKRCTAVPLAQPGSVGRGERSKNGLSFSRMVIYRIRYRSKCRIVTAPGFRDRVLYAGTGIRTAHHSHASQQFPMQHVDDDEYRRRLFYVHNIIIRACDRASSERRFSIIVIECTADGHVNIRFSEKQSQPLRYARGS